MSDKCPLCGDSMIFTLYSAHMDEDGTTRDEQCCHIVDGEACLRRQLAALQDENTDLKAIVDAIDELRDHEVSSVTIHHANPEFGGPDQLIEVYGWWTDEGPRRVEGESLIDCLTKALTMKRAAEAAKENPGG